MALYPFVMYANIMPLRQDMVKSCVDGLVIIIVARVPEGTFMSWGYAPVLVGASIIDV